MLQAVLVSGNFASCLQGAAGDSGLAGRAYESGDHYIYKELKYLNELLSKQLINICLLQMKIYYIMEQIIKVREKPLLNFKNKLKDIKVYAYLDMVFSCLQFTSN